MKIFSTKKIFEWYWEEIRLFARWAMHSGHCRQGITWKDYQRFLSEKQQWIKQEEHNEMIKEAIGRS